jgi:hypothetical protein
MGVADLAALLESVETIAHLDPRTDLLGGDLLEGVAANRGAQVLIREGVQQRSRRHRQEDRLVATGDLDLDRDRRP